MNIKSFVLGNRSFFFYSTFQVLIYSDPKVFPIPKEQPPAGDRALVSASFAYATIVEHPCHYCNCSPFRVAINCAAWKEQMDVT